MNGNNEMLNYIFQNSGMGVDTVTQLIEIASEPAFLKLLEIQLEEYTAIHTVAIQKIHAMGKQEKDITKMAQISTYLTINMKTMLDNSPSHISEMLIQGSTMGVVDATKKLKEYADADADIIKLAQRLLKTEQNNIEQLKHFL